MVCRVVYMSWPLFSSKESHCAHVLPLIFCEEYTVCQKALYLFSYRKIPIVVSILGGVLPWLADEYNRPQCCMPFRLQSSTDITFHRISIWLLSVPVTRWSAYEVEAVSKSMSIGPGITVTARVVQDAEVGHALFACHVQQRGRQLV